MYDPTKDKNHVHRYNLATTKNVFELYTRDTTIIDLSDVLLYEMVEYAYLTCACTDTIRVRVKHSEEFPQ